MVKTHNSRFDVLLVHSGDPNAGTLQEVLESFRLSVLPLDSLKARDPASQIRQEAGAATCVLLLVSISTPSESDFLDFVRKHISEHKLIPISTGTCSIPQPFAAIQLLTVSRFDRWEVTGGGPLYSLLRMVERITQKHLGLGESAAEHNRNADHVQVHVNGESYRYEGVMTSLWLASENYREYRRAQERTREKRWRDADKRHTPAHPEYVPAKPAQFLEHGSGPGTFISYSRVDYHVASRLTEVLSMAGQNYWWDDGILPGEIWEARLREKLAAARCILVLWSRSSPASKWIQLEAGEGYRRGILLNLKLDESSIPEPFLKAETFDFCGCAFALNAPLTRSLLSRLGQMLGSCLIF